MFCNNLLVITGIKNTDKFHKHDTIYVTLKGTTIYPFHPQGDNKEILLILILSVLSYYLVQLQY